MARKSLILTLAVAAGLLAVGPPASAQPVIDREYEIKGAFLYQFTKYVEWPKNAIPGEDDFVIGVVGKDPFGGLLDTIAASKTVQGKKVAVRRFRSVKDYTPCHLLFIAASGDDGAEEKTVDDRAKAAAAKTKGSPTLLVGDSEGLAQKGAMINFYIEDNKVKFEINPEAANRASLGISSQLLKLSIAKIVKDGAGGKP